MKEKNSIATLHQISFVEQNYPSLMIEHVNDIIQRIRFILSLDIPPTRPSSSIRRSAKKPSSSSSLRKANILFEDISSKDFNLKSIKDTEIQTKLCDCHLVMSIDYFSNNQTGNPETPKLYALETYKAPLVEIEDYEYKSSVKLSKGIIGYETFKSFLSHIFQMIINRLVRTAHLADISTNNKSNKGNFNLKITKFRKQTVTPRLY